MKNIRNFSIIAHIDHGKSTLSDRLLELCGVKTNRDENLVLDNMELERERGITIKSQTARMEYKAKDGNMYVLNLIDTPGHMDFNYEVSRSLSASEGALLLVDATQGIEAQTIVNYNLAIENNLNIIGVINKIDLATADVEKTIEEMENILAIPREEIIKVSAKTGEGVPELLEALIKYIRPPVGESDHQLKGLIIDSNYDSYKGIVIKVRIVDGQVKKGDKLVFLSNQEVYEVHEVGIYRLKLIEVEELIAGDVGYIITGIKTVSDVHVGDTISNVNNPVKDPLPGFKKVKPMVFAGLYPANGDEYENLKDALTKLQLNDASLTYIPNNSPALGFGFRCGFLGLLHIDIVQERLEREFNINLIITAPNVKYRVGLPEGKLLEIDNPSEFPENIKIDFVEEPFVKAIIISPSEFIGNIMSLMTDYRGIYISTEYINPQRVELIYEVPFSEVIFDFLNKLKSVTRGYASFDYELMGYRKSDLVKVDILIHKSPVDALSIIVHRDKAYFHSRKIVHKLRGIIPRQMFEVAVQAAIGSKVIARETIAAKRKDVLAKCYGGDITRKRKLLEKQKEGKKRMKKVGNVDIPQEAFLSILQVEKE